MLNWILKNVLYWSMERNEEKKKEKVGWLLQIKLKKIINFLEINDRNWIYFVFWKNLIGLI